MARRSSLFVDRLVLTIDIPQEDREDIRCRIPTTDDPSWRINRRGPSGIYETNFNLDLGNQRLERGRWDDDAPDRSPVDRPESQLGTSAYVSIAPRYRHQRYLRIEYSPHAAGESGRQRLREFIEVLLGRDYERRIREARISRIDVGFDVWRVKLADLRIEMAARQGQRFRRQYVGASGELETIYLPAGGIGFLAIYDKKRDLNRRNKKESLLRGTTYAPRVTECVRFEYRWSKKKFTWAEVIALPNNFMRYDVRAFQHLSTRLDADLERLFFDAGGTRSITRLLESINGTSPQERILRRNRLRLSSNQLPIPEWWNPSEFWRELPLAIANIGVYPIGRNTLRNDPVARMLSHATRGIP